MIGLDQVRRVLRRAATPYIGCLSNPELDRRLGALETELAETREDIARLQAQAAEFYTGTPGGLHIFDGSRDA